jgi:hypothetical protein
MTSTKGGAILEAEDAKHSSSKIETEIDGFTGSGYIPENNNHAQYYAEWSHEVEKPGKYILEFRYTLTRDRIMPGFLKINGEEIEGLTFWDTGNPGNWVWERVVVDLKQGTNTINISPEGYVKLDHLNIIMKK